MSSRSGWSTKKKPVVKRKDKKSSLMFSCARREKSWLR